MNAPSQGSAQPDPRFLNHRTAKVLIVEDEKLVAWDMEQTLREAGLEKIAVMHSLRDAGRDLSAENGISLVIMDLKLGDEDSGRLIEELQSRSIPVLVVTGYHGFAHPGVSVIDKPYASEDLLATVARLLASPR
jgi:DNA-binding NtrC family response regulator